MATQDVPTLEDLASDLAGTETTDVNNEAVEQDATTEESSPKETQEPVAEETEETDGEAESEDEEQSPEETEPEEPAPTKADERKQTLNSEIRDLVAERNRLRSEIETVNAQVYAPQSPEEIMEETGQSQADARITAMEQRQELIDYNNRIAEANLVLESESERVYRDFPMFDSNSPQYNETIATEAADLLRANLQVDPNTGQIIGSNISPYKLFSTIARANQASAVENQLKGQKSAEQMLASAEPSSSATPVQPKEDPFLAGLTKGYEK